MAPTLYVLPASPVVRAVLITAKALGLTLNQHELDFFKGEHLSPEYLKLNPQHTTPTLEDNGKVIWDSHAIMGYLVGTYAKDDSLYPKDPYKRALVDQRLYFEAGVLYPVLRNVDLGYINKEFKAVPPKMAEEIKQGYDFLETFLKGRQWVIGNSVTIADFSLYPTVTSLDVHIKLDPKTYPNITEWIKRVKALPCCSSDHEGMKSFTDFIQAVKS